MQGNDMEQERIRLVYTSIHGGIGERARRSLVQEALELNAKHSIGGLLVVGEEDFFGVLEGAPIVVTNMLLNIARDHRHHSMNILLAETLKVKMCDDWKVMDLAELEESKRQLAQHMVAAAVTSTEIDSEELTMMILALTAAAQSSKPEPKDKS